MNRCSVCRTRSNSEISRGSFGLTERTIQRIENHEVEPSAHSLRRISHVLGEDFLSAKMKRQKRLQRVLSGIVSIWTLAIAYNVFFSPFDWTQRWYEVLFGSLPDRCGQGEIDSLTREISKYLNYRYLRDNHSAYEEPHFRLLPPNCHLIFDSTNAQDWEKRHAFAKAYFGAGAYYMPSKSGYCFKH